MDKQTLSFSAIGTLWKIDIPSLPQETYFNVIKMIRDRINTFDQTYSRFLNDSFVSYLSKHTGTFPLPEDAFELLTFYEKMYEISDGTFTPFIGNVLEDAGYDRTYSLKEKKLHTPPLWDDAISFTEKVITIKQPVLLDFGAAGKGYLIDKISSLLRENNISEFCIDAGGDIYYVSQNGNRLRVGLEHPDNPEQVIGVTTILNQSICASSGNRRTWGKYHHIINPKTLSSPKDIRSVWVIADTAMLADGIATCLFFTPADVLQKSFSFEHLLLFSDYTIKKSHQFTADIYYT